MTFAPPDKLPFGATGWQELVDSIAAEDDTVETHYLERKGDEALSSKETRAKVAKFILGAANRMPEVAERALGGYAILLLGVSHGAVSGIPKIEDHDVHAGLAKLLGLPQPRWEIVRVPVDADRDVMIIVVHPPAHGDPIWACHADGSGIYDGAIYVRSPGQTRPASGAEINQLTQRAIGQKREFTFDVEFVGEIFAVTWDEVVVEEYVESESRRLLQSIQKSIINPVDAAVGRSFNILSALKREETRSEGEYRMQVDAYLAELRTAVPDLAIALASVREAPVWQVRNGPTGFHQGVELTIHLEGDVWAHRATSNSNLAQLRHDSLPKAPDTWGDKYESRMFNPVIPANLSRPYLGPTYPTIDWHNSGSVTMRTPTFDLRPGAVWEFDQSDRSPFLYVLDDQLAEVPVAWAATAEGMHEQLTGNLAIPVAQGLDVTDGLRRVLFPKKKDA